MAPHAAPAAALAHAAIRGDRGAFVDGALMAQLVKDGGELAPGVPAICVAANFGSVPVIQALVAAGADVNASYGREPFRGWLGFTAARRAAPPTGSGSLRRGERRTRTSTTVCGPSPSSWCAHGARR